MGLPLSLVAADLENSELPVEQFEVVLCFYYLQRTLFSPIMRALKLGGALVMETYTIDQLQFSHGPRTPEHLLQPNELYQAFRQLRVGYYREIVREHRAIASLLAYKL